MKTSKLLFVLALFPQISFATDPDTVVVRMSSVIKLTLVQASVDKQEGFYILDTGTPDLVLNRTYFDGELSEKVFYGINDEFLDIRTKYVDLRIGDFEVRVKAKIIDFSAIESLTGVPILGAIGNDAFKDCEIVFDYVFNNEFTIYRLDENGNPLNRKALHQSPSQTLPFLNKGSMPSVLACIGGQSVRLGLDSGAGANLVDKRKKSPFGCCLKDLGKKRLRGFGAAVEMTPFAEISGLAVGEIHCKPMQAFVTSLHQFNSDLKGPDIDGIMGYEFLSRYRTAINFRKKEVYIWDTDYVQQQLADAQAGK